jgi:predicted PurR-regulated permease PerM
MMAADDRSRVSLAQMFRWAVAGTSGVLVVLLGAYGIFLVRGILVLVVIALFLSISIEPVVRWLTRRGMPRAAAVAVVVVTVVVLAAAFIWSLVPPIVNQSGRLAHELPVYVDRWSDGSKAIREVADRYHVTERLTAVVSGLPAKLAGGAVGYFRRFIGTAASALTVLVLTIYFTADLPRLRRSLVATFPPARRGRAAEIIDVMVEKVGGYMIGNIIISVIAGVTSFICLKVLGIPYPLPLAVIVAVADLIPMIGAALGATVCMVVALFTVGLWPRTVILVLFFVLYQLVENYLLVPRIFRNTVDLPAAVVLLAALVGGTVLGLVGALMAIPIAATVKVVISPAVTEQDKPPSDSEAESPA